MDTTRPMAHAPRNTFQAAESCFSRKYALRAYRAHATKIVAFGKASSGSLPVTAVSLGVYTLAVDETISSAIRPTGVGYLACFVLYGR